MRRVAFQTLYDEFYSVLTAVGFSDQRAALCAKLFAENQRDGVYSHGLNRYQPGGRRPLWTFFKKSKPFFF